MSYQICKSWINLNAFHAAGECRQQVILFTHFVKIINILEFHDHIWNHHEKCIQISTNMPGIGSLICEIGLEMKELWGEKYLFFARDSITRVLSVNLHVCLLNPQVAGNGTTEPPLTLCTGRTASQTVWNEARIAPSCTTIATANGTTTIASTALDTCARWNNVSICCLLSTSGVCPQCGGDRLKIRPTFCVWGVLPSSQICFILGSVGWIFFFFKLN